MRFRLLIFQLLIASNLVFSFENLNNIIVPSITPGNYNNDIELSFSSVDGIEIYYSFNESLDKSDVKYIFPLSLSAMSGETREYNIKVTARDQNEILESLSLKYTIDKSVPELPVLNLTGGLYNRSLDLKFIETDSDIYYETGSQNETGFHLWKGESINIPQQNSLSTEYVKSYSEDSAGNRSAVKVTSFTILPVAEEPVALNILSPVEGVFLNSQLIYIDTSGYKWIRYSFNDIDPVARGTSYIKPVMVKAVGEYKLNIAAMPYSSNNILKKEIKFSIIDNKEIIINKTSGVYTEDINLKFNNSGLNYTREERSVVSWDPTLPDFISVMPIPGVVKYQVIRISEIGEEGEYRYFFALDKRVPAAPVISVSSGIPITSETEARILGVPGADIYYSLDGSTPDRYSSYYRRPFILDIPDGRSTGSLLIKAVAYLNDKSISPVATKLITFDITKPEMPELEIISKTSGEAVFKFVNSSGNKIIYNISYDGTDPEDPVSTSFTGEKIMRVRVPNGIVADIKIAAAYMNQAGNISDTTRMNLIHTDSIPPMMPEISLEKNIVTITGEGTIWYRNHDSGLNELQEYQLYKEPLIINTEDSNFVSVNIWAYSVDEYGNSSEVAKINKKVVDNRIPVLPSFSGIKDGELYNNPRTLRFHTAEDIEIFYTLSDNSDMPEDPDPKISGKLEEYLFFDCPVNETRDYTVKLIASYPESDKQSDIKTISFKIDRISPRAPVIRSIRDGAVYNNNITINKNEEGDYLWILLKEEIVPGDLTVSNFESNGILLDNDYVIKLDEQIEKHYQLAALSIDNAGNAIIGQDIIKFSIDKLPPIPPEIKVDTNSDIFTTVRLLSSASDDILYEVSYNGSYPKDPDNNSKIYNLPLQFEKDKYGTVFIKARTIDSSGNLSNETVSRKILMDNSDLKTPSISVSQINSSEYIVSFPTTPGLSVYVNKGDGEFTKYKDPMTLELRDANYIDIFYYAESAAGKKSSVAVHRIEKITTAGKLITGISDNKIYNGGRVVWKSNESRIVRYEVAIGDQLPAGVNVFSPELTEPILFDAGIGETIKINISVKEFSDNIPVLEKYDSTYSFVIDKTRPDSPAIVGVTNNGFFTDDRVVELISDSSVFYKLSSDSRDVASVEYIKYTEPLDFKVSPGKSVLYKLEMYSKDSAGNRSDTEIVEFTIDKANIFVSLRGKDSNDGTRERPFKTLEKAITYSIESKRNYINITEGEFELKKTISIDKKINIIGGYKSGDWTEGSGITLLNIPEKYSGNNPLINIESGKVLIQNLTMTNINLKAPIIKVSGGVLDLVNVNLFHANISIPVSLEVNNGKLNLRNTNLNYGSVANGKLISVTSGLLTINDSVIEGSGPVKDLKIFIIDDSDIEITNSKVLTSDGDRISFIDATASNIEINKTTFIPGSSNINSDIFLIKTSKLKLSVFKLLSNDQSRIISVFDMENSEVQIENSAFDLKALTGISFCRTKNSTLEIEDSSIKTDITDEFVYLVKSESSIIDLQDNVIITKPVDIFKGFDLVNSVSVFNMNKIIFGGGDTYFSSFYFNDPLSVEFTSNVFISSNRSWISSVNQAALKISGGKDSVILTGNNFYGWDNVLDHNGSIVKTTADLNNYRKFLDIPEDNYSKLIE